MYNQYITYVGKYFPNAVPVVDSFHVIQWIIRKVDNYIRQLLKKYRQRDRELQEKLSRQQQKTVSFPVSDEVYILQKYRWLILSNQSNILYHSDLRMDPHFHVLMNTQEQVACMLILVQKKLNMSVEQAGDFVRKAIGINA